MGYDDPQLKEFENYYIAKKAGLRERAENWAVAIGLQRVDGLRPSNYLIEIAKKHIEGEISDVEATSLVDKYYESKVGHDAPEDEKEADRVAARINEVIGDDGFNFSPSYLIGLHGLIFEGVFPHAGFIREVNLRKREWVLRGESVTYGHAPVIERTLDYDFDREREYSYADGGKRNLIAHFARFIAGIWQIHPFREGNTRTTAVFAIKYLRSMKVNATNDLFAQNSWFFRNALVRANYEDPLKGIHRDFAPLERFFESLILGRKNNLQNRYLLVGLTENERRQFAGDQEKRSEKGGQKKAVRKGGQKRWSEKGGQKTRDRLIRLLDADPHLSREGLSAALGICPSAIQKHLAKLKKDNRIRRIGPDKGGHWEVVAP